MLLAAWRKHLPIHGVEQEPRRRDESEVDYLRRIGPHWVIVEHVAWSGSVANDKLTGVLNILNILNRTQLRWP
jgi:hypothetical protein